MRSYFYNLPAKFATYNKKCVLLVCTFSLGQDFEYLL